MKLFQFNLLASIFVLASVNFSFAQNYIPMLTDSLYWDIAYRVNDPNPCAMYGYPKPFRYKTDLDTTINNVVYQTVIKYELFPATPAPCPPFYIDTVLQNTIIYLREDTAGQKVYYYNTFSQTDVLLFDFSLQQGDSIFVPSITPNTYFYVDTLYNIVTADGITRKYFQCDEKPWLGTTGGFYIEGLGGAMGIFGPFNTFEEGYWLMCISDLNQSPIVGSFGDLTHFYDCYNFTTGFPENNDPGNGITLSPNPATDFINISNLPFNTAITIRNALGEIIAEHTFSSDTRLDISNYEPGLYFLTVEHNSINKASLFIKM